MSTLTASPEYIELLKKFPPRVIRTEKENEACTEILYDLDRRSSKLTPAEKELADLLTLLIEDFEDRHYQLPRGAIPRPSPFPGRLRPTANEFPIR